MKIKTIVAISIMLLIILLGGIVIANDYSKDEFIKLSGDPYP